MGIAYWIFIGSGAILTVVVIGWFVALNVAPAVRRVIAAKLGIEATAQGGGGSGSQGGWVGGDMLQGWRSDSGFDGGGGGGGDG